MHLRMRVSWALVTVLVGLTASCGGGETSDSPALSSRQYPLGLVPVAVQYADSHWNWDWYDPNHHGTVSAGDGQPNFACAEFVARALAAAGLFPGLGPDDPQSSYASYWLNGRDYHLWNTGTADVVGLHDYLLDNGLGVDVGDNPSLASPGDPVFYYNGSVTAANREHVEILVAAGKTPGGGDTLADSHNFAALHISYANSGYYNSSGQFVAYSRSIVHLQKSSSPLCINDPGVGNNCGDESVISGGSASTLYHCNGYGPATVVQVCSSGCQHNPPGVDDACKSPTVLCVNNPGVGNNCGDESVISGGNASTLYHCNGYGQATVVQVCSSGCQHNPPGINDVCRDLKPPTAACGAGDANGPDNGWCGQDSRVYYCYQKTWHLKDDCTARGATCTYNPNGADYCR